MGIDLKRLFRLILTVITLSTGIIVLLSFVFENEMLSFLRSVFVEWTIIIVAFAMLLGIWNVLRVHAQRIQNRQGMLYSLILVGAFLAVFIPGMMPPDQLPLGLDQYSGPRGVIVDFAYRYVQRPLQAALFSLTAFFVLTAAWRAFRIRSAGSLMMLIASVLVLLGSIKFGVGDGWNFFTDIKDWLSGVVVMAGARGILLGIALGTVVTGLRLLVGVDRPYSD